MLGIPRLFFAATTLCVVIDTAIVNAATYVASGSGLITSNNSNLPGFVIGDAVSFSITYDSGIAPVNAPFLIDPSKEGYYPSPTLISWTIQLGSYAATATGGAGYVANGINLPGWDTLLFAATEDSSNPYAGDVSGSKVGAYSPFIAQMLLRDFQGTALNSSALPLATPPLTDFDIRAFTFLFRHDENSQFASIDASISSFSVSEVPLPAALPLFATVLAGGGLIAWRRKRKAAKSAA